MAHQGRDIRRGILVLHHGVAHAGLVREIFRRVRKQAGSAVPLDGFHEGFGRLRKNRVLRRAATISSASPARPPKLRSICGSKMRSAGGKRQFAFARGTAVTQIVNHFKAEWFHRMPASNTFWLSTIVPEEPGAPSAASPARSIPAIRPKSRLRYFKLLFGGEAARLAGGHSYRAAACHPQTRTRVAAEVETESSSDDQPTWWASGRMLPWSRHPDCAGLIEGSWRILRCAIAPEASAGFRSSIQRNQENAPTKHSFHWRHHVG